MIQNAFVRKTPYKYDSISGNYIKQDKISSIDMAKEISNEFFDGNKLKEEITYSKLQEILENISLPILLIRATSIHLIHMMSITIQMDICMGLKLMLI